MKFLLKQIEKKKSLYAPGGKLEKLFPLYEAGDTFMFTPPDVTQGATHIRDTVDLKRSMIMVVVALLPAFLFGMYNAGYQYHTASGIDAGFWGHTFMGARWVLPIVLVSYLAGGFWEVLFAVVRKHEINEGFLVTGLLFPLVLPPTIPLWQVAVGISFGVVVGKEVFGGTGFNILNPALTARAYLFFANAKSMTGDIWIKTTDGMTGATPLGLAAEMGSRQEEVVGGLQAKGFTLTSMFQGLEAGSIGETSVIAILIGAVILIVTGVASWRIMLGGALGLAATAFLVNFLPDTFTNAEGEKVLSTTYKNIPFVYHFVMGGFLFGLVFMATDPVSASATNTGKWIYGILIGVVTVLVRVVNPAFPEGTMLAILFMNVMAPVIDYTVVRFHIRKRTAYLGKFRHAEG